MVESMVRNEILVNFQSKPHKVLVNYREEMNSGAYRHHLNKPKTPVLGHMMAVHDQHQGEHNKAATALPPIMSSLLDVNEGPHTPKQGTYNTTARTN